MATYVNNLRLTEITTGDESGTWGTTTNSNWDFATDAFGYGVKNMAGDADQTFTMADGSVDTLRSMYLKITSTVAPLTATRTLTIAPNTVSKVWIIENNTAGSQSIIIKQGSGADVTIATGTKVMVYSDGAGAGAAVISANFTAATSGTVTSVAASVPSIFSIAGSPITTSGTLAMTYSGTALPVANGGTGATTLTANYALLGNGTSAPQMIAPSTSGNVLTSNGTTWASSAPAAGGITYTTTKTTTYTAVANDGVLTNTTGGAFTVNLPASPANGDQVIVADAGGTWGTNNLTVGRNGNNIADVAQDLVCDISGVSVQFVYNTSGTATWEVYAQVGGNGGTVVTLDGVQTLTNKTLTSPVLTAPVLGTVASGVISACTSTSMALVTPVLGTPTSGTLSACTVDGTNLVGFKSVPAVGTKTASYTLAVGDVGKYVQLGASGAIVIPDATFAEGNAITLFNNTASTSTITCSITTAYIAGTFTDKATMTLAAAGVATILFISGTTCVVAGNVT
jgi:hypothetical protein